MGNQQSSQVMMGNPAYAKVIRSLNLQNEKEGHTYSMAHRYFSVEFARADRGKFDRSMNPFCPLNITNSGNWLTTCLVNPIMALATPIYLFNNNEQFSKECTVLPVYKGSQISVQVKQAIIIHKQNLCLLIIDIPYWRVGWAGISYIKNVEQLHILDMKMVSHPQKVLNKQTGQMVHQQQVNKFKVSKVATLSNEFTLTSQGNVGVLYCKIVDKKPYIIGIQISQMQVLFFNQETYNLIQQQAKKYIKKHQNEKEILKQMDMKQFQIETEL